MELFLYVVSIKQFFNSLGLIIFHLNSSPLSFSHLSSILIQFLIFSLLASQLPKTELFLLIFVLFNFLLCIFLWWSPRWSPHLWFLGADFILFILFVPFYDFIDFRRIRLRACVCKILLLFVTFYFVIILVQSSRFLSWSCIVVLAYTYNRVLLLK